jgi:aryl-alcohol dehydrogenase-like predicted oxidoreductase
MSDPSRTRTLGPTRLPVTAIGLGLAALGRPGYLNVGHGVDLGSDRSEAALELRTHEVLDAAYAAGVRYFDAARSYGRAEAFLSSWLRLELGRDRLHGAQGTSADAGSAPNATTRLRPSRLAR